MCFASTHVLQGLSTLSTAPLCTLYQHTSPKVPVSFLYCKKKLYEAWHNVERPYKAALQLLPSMQIVNIG